MMKFNFNFQFIFFFTILHLFIPINSASAQYQSLSMAIKIASNFYKRWKPLVDQFVDAVGVSNRVIETGKEANRKYGKLNNKILLSLGDLSLTIDRIDPHYPDYPLLKFGLEDIKTRESCNEQFEKLSKQQKQQQKQIRQDIPKYARLVKLLEHLRKVNSHFEVHNDIWYRSFNSLPKAGMNAFLFMWGGALTTMDSLQGIHFDRGELIREIYVKIDRKKEKLNKNKKKLEKLLKEFGNIDHNLKEFAGGCEEISTIQLKEIAEFFGILENENDKYKNKSREINNDGMNDFIRNSQRSVAQSSCSPAENQRIVRLTENFSQKRQSKKDGFCSLARDSQRIYRQILNHFNKCPSDDSGGSMRQYAKEMIAWGQKTEHKTCGK